MLRQAREAAKLTIEEVADELHLVKEVVEALENGDKSRLPSRVFTLGYLKNYAKLVNLPYEQLKAAYDDIAEEQIPILNQPRAPQIRQQARSGNWLIKAVSWLLFFGLLLLVFLWWKGDMTIPDMGKGLPFSLQHPLQPPVEERPGAQNQDLGVTLDPGSGQPLLVPIDQSGPEPAVTLQDNISPPLEPAAVQPSEPVETQPAVTQETADTQGLPAEPVTAETGDSMLAVPLETAAGVNAGETATTPVDETLGIELEPAEPPANPALSSLSSIMPPQDELEPIMPVQPPAQSQLPAASDAAIRISFSGRCWVQVTDASGSVLLSGEMQEGESKEIDGDTPLRFVFGNARVVQLYVGGEPFDLDPHTSGNVARFTLEATEG
jgi:cytoskeleton protein RodZ